MLVKTEGIYGDWYIMDNRYNLSIMCNKEIKEPFAFSVDNLLGALRGIECSSLYTSDLTIFDMVTFINRIKNLIL